MKHRNENGGNPFLTEYTNFLLEITNHKGNGGNKKAAGAFAPSDL